MAQMSAKPSQILASKQPCRLRAEVEPNGRHGGDGRTLTRMALEHRAAIKLLSAPRPEIRFEAVQKP